MIMDNETFRQKLLDEEQPYLTEHEKELCRVVAFYATIRGIIIGLTFAGCLLIIWSRS